MSRPSVRHDLRRVGLAPRPRLEEGRKGPRPPRVFLEGETPGEPTPLVWAEVFGRAAAVELEIGSGKGRFLLAEAAAHPERDYLGAELELDYARLCRRKAERRSLPNVRFEALDGKAFLALRVPPASLAALHVYFPDPWPKKRHQKRRVVDAAFAAAAARALGPGAPVRVASDHGEYFAALASALDAEPGLERVSGGDAFVTGTNFEEKSVAAGKPVYRGTWRASSEPSREASGGSAAASLRSSGGR